MVVLSLVGREEVGPHGEPGVVEAVHGSAVLPCGLEGGSLLVPAQGAEMVVFAPVARVVVVAGIRVVEAVDRGISPSGGRPGHALAVPADLDEAVVFRLRCGEEVLPRPLVEEAVDALRRCGVIRQRLCRHGEAEGERRRCGQQRQDPPHPLRPVLSLGHAVLLSLGPADPWMSIQIAEA